MTEPATEATPDVPTGEAATAEPEDGTDWKAEARKWEQRAKENKAAAAEMEKARKASLTDAERAVAEAEERTAARLRAEYGQRFARSEFVAEAAKRNPTWDATAVLEDLNFSRYVGDDGEPDSKAIAAAVARIVPGSTQETAGPPPFDLGARKTVPPSQSMSDVLRKAAGRA